MGESRGRRARHPRDGTAELLGQGGDTPYAAAAIPRKPQPGYFGEKVGGSATVGWRPDIQEEIQNPDGAIAKSTKRLASRYYQPKTGHARTGECLHWAKARPTAQCWWCQRPWQTRDRLFKVCPQWKMQQKTLWAEVQTETGRWKNRWMVRDPLADGRCGQAVLDFLSSTDVERLVPPLEKEAEADELGAAEELGAGEELPLFLPTPSSWHWRTRSRGRTMFPMLFPL